MTLSSQIFSPYRICPIGAHVDHQGGVVLGRTLRLGTTVHYEPLEAPVLQITSDQFGEAVFAFDDQVDLDHWARYAQAAVRVFQEHLKHGVKFHVSGPLAGSGLSSSASVGLAYLKALADINGIAVTGDDLVSLDRQLENTHLGLRNGILDPLTIVHGHKNALLFIDTISASVTRIDDPESSDAAWIVADSGVSRELTKSGYNNRVGECIEAADLLQPGAKKLAEVSRDVYDARKNRLPEIQRRRADHFFSEVDRVHQGVQAWKDADFEYFGDLMNRSCASSISKYEVGHPILIELHEIASQADGIFGSRFCGGGFGGCVVALAKKEHAPQAARVIADAFHARHPELASQVFLAETGDGFSRVNSNGAHKSAQAHS